MIAVSSATAMVLFDPSASHSFISREYVEEHKITMLLMRKPLIVNSLGGEKKANRLCPKVSLNIKGKNFEANLIVLELMNIDVILGNGWLSACKRVIKYAVTPNFKDKVECTKLMCAQGSVTHIS